MNHKVCDIHAHIIPGVDDGASNFDMAIDILREAYTQGTRSIVCTSHSGYNAKRYLGNFEHLKQYVKKENIEINLYSGCEIYCNSDIMPDVLAELRRKEVFTINETEYVLVEFDPNALISEIVYCIKFLQNHRYSTILAHTERYVNLSVGGVWIKLLHQMGCFFQINAYSFYDTCDDQIKSFARWMLKEQYVTFIGSDVHHTSYRKYAVKNGIDYVYQNCDAEYAKDICYRNAEKILNMK